MGFLDSLFGDSNQRRLKVDFTPWVEHFLQMGEWSYKPCETAEGHRPFCIVTNMSNRVVTASMFFCQACGGEVGYELARIKQIVLPTLKPGESGELEIPLYTLGSNLARINRIILDVRDKYRVEDEDEDEDSEDEYEEGEATEDARSVDAKTSGVASQLLTLSGWEVGEDEAGPVVLGLIEYKGGDGCPDLINSRQLKVTLYHGRKRQPVRKVNGFAQPFTLERGQSVCARVDLSPLGKKSLSKLRASAVMVEFLEDTAIAESGRRGEVLWDHNGTVLGPFSTAQLKGFAAAGLVHGTDRLSQDGKRTWTVAAQVPNISALVVPRWYYAKNSKQRLGPFSTAQLAQLAIAGLLQPTDMVLKEGASRWVQAATVSELSFPKPSA